jgi:hypothetical protein
MTYVAFVLDVDSFNIDYWYIDNLDIKGQTGYTGDLVYSEWYCVDEIDVCESLEFCLDPFIPEIDDDCGSKLYQACARTALCDPMDDNTANDLLCEVFEVVYSHDVSIEVTSPAENKAPWDLLFSFDVTAASGAAGNAGSEFDGTYFYSARWASNLIHQYDITGALVSQFSIAGVTGLRDLAFDGTYMWGGNGAGTLWKMDFGTQTLITTYTGSFQSRAIAYDTDANEILCSGWADPVYRIDPNTGSILGTFNLGTTTSTYGFAYDSVSGGPYLWVFDQTYTPSAGMVYQWDLGLGAYTGFQFDVATDLGQPADIAGGLHMMVYGSKWCVAGLLQGVPDTMFVYELCDAPGALPTPDVYIPCGEQDICVLVKNLGTFDEVDDPATPCDWEGATVFYELYKWIWDDPCVDPVKELEATGVKTFEILCGEEKEVCFDPYDFEVAAVYEIYVTVDIPVDCNEDDNEASLIIGVDCCDPISEHTLTPLLPDGENNWYLQDVTVKITAYDPLCPDPCLGTASGLKEIHYILNGVETVKTGNEVTFKIKDEGVNLVEYWAVDNAGNAEEHFTFEVAIDKTKPTVDLIYEKIEDGTLVVKFTAVASDATSGISKVEFYIDATLDKTLTAPPFVWEVTWQDSYKTVTFKAKVYDSAGNFAEDTVFGGDIPGAKFHIQSQAQSQSQAHVATQQI